ncbi:hypothetical protein HYFRA_00008567 [Hymenoscyphus fraxineus]|uniref:Zn(2)-C6 fungal-type domain-containing protein n=1 Tax=Hymenoscyphus fraxineus TaxID=746836 RepID=A0A9N9KV62_9HELO|nr:hypothetical protein HYFRA_00008567 [Hymenoscyphus fraxineus]
MVYCGKPSRGCQMCRTRRIKCDETKPTCNQCAKSRRQCPGYKDDFDLVFRNETQATERRARKASNGKKGNNQIVISSSQPVFNTDDDGDSFIPSGSDKETGMVRLAPMVLSIPVEEQAPCYFLENFVVASTNAVDTPRGYFDFLAPLMKNEGPEDHLTLAFNAASLAALANRPNTRSKLDMKQMAMASYAKALKATNLALQSPTLQKTDQTLAAILMLGFYETVCTNNTNPAAWYSHVNGAIQIVRMRGKKQLRTKVGQSLFQVVRTQMVINCMTSSKVPSMGADWWTPDIGEDYGVAITRIKLHIAELRAEMNDTLSTCPRTPEYFQMVADIMRRAHVMEQEYHEWEASLPEWWRPKTVAWVDNHAATDFSKSEVCPGKVESYHNIWVATIWNHARVARIGASGIIVRCAAWMCSPVDYRTTPEYAHATRLCVDLVTDIISSVPFHLGWDIGKGGSLSSADPLSFEAGLEAFSNPKGYGGFFALWPLFVCSTADYITDSQRAWVKGRMMYISETLGLNHAKVLAGFQIRVPSMIIRRDNIGRTPQSQIMAAHVYTPPSPNAPKSGQVINMNSHGNTANAMNGYTMSPLQQRELMQKEIFEKERLSLLKKAGDNQPEVEKLMAKYLAV